jgi:hypothetical protein
MKLAVYSTWQESKDKKFLAIPEYNSRAKIVDFGYGDGHFLGNLGEAVDMKRCRFVMLKLRKFEDEING